MKIGIITCHDICNFGSSLQAYALCSFLEEKVDSVELIDYKPEYMYRLINLMEVDSIKWKKNFLTRWIYRIYTAPHKLKFIKKAIAYRRFNKKLLTISNKKFKTYEELLQIQKYDTLICGSDQIWNSNKYKCGEDPAFFLGFTDKTKISYAASFGGGTVSKTGEENIKKYLPSFSAISVRESYGIDLLHEFGIHAEHVIDPVFLLSADKWRKIAKKPKNLPDKYILVYGYDNSSEFFQMINEYKDYNLITIDSDILRDAGPLEFIWLVDNAEMVLTTSFHAVSFSIILHTNFITSGTDNSQLYERLNDIMSRCGLEGRRYNLLSKKENWKDEKIDYDEVDLSLCEFIDSSKKFLLSSLGVCNEN